LLGLLQGKVDVFYDAHTRDGPMYRKPFIDNHERILILLLTWPSKLAGAVLVT